MQVHRWEQDYRGRFKEWPVPEMVRVGARFRNGRHQLGISQRRLSELSKVSQSVISRFERGLVTGITAERLVRIANALGHAFPFGFCPHDHQCAWPFDPDREPNLQQIFRTY